MKKVFDQTVRDLKREVNKKVLKVPGIEQKVLDATSNEPWGPHGSLLADIAMASRNYHEYQMIMAVIWKRINDTGKNWRHVYKGLTVLDYLVAHGSERVIDDIREHAYQISTLSDFQYIDSSGRDQGSNVRKKSQSLVALVNDKERIIEVRQKAAANRDKYRNSSMSAMYRPGSGGYGDKHDYDRYEGRYGSRDDDQSGYSNGRERENGYRDDDRYGDRYGQDYEDRYGRDGYRDDDYRGRSRGGEEYQSGSRSRSSDRYRSYDDDGHFSARGSGARADDQFPDRSRHERKFSEQNIDVPPSYEEAVSESRSPVHSERNGENTVAAAPRAASPHESNNPSQATSAPEVSSSPVTKEGEAFDEFDPRSSTSAAPMTTAAATATPVASASPDFDLLALAIVPTSLSTGETDVHPNSATVNTFSSSQPATNGCNQPFDDPFGDGPFRAEQTSTSIPPSQPSMNQNGQMPHVSGVYPPSTNSQFQAQEMTSSNPETDILAGLFPPPGPSHADVSQTAFSVPTGQPSQPGSHMFGQPAQQGLNMYGQPAQQDNCMYAQPGQQAHSSHPGANAYGQQPHSSANGYGHQAQPGANPYGQQPQPGAGPYAPPGQSVVNSYGQPANVYSQPSQPIVNPYGPNLNNSSGSFNTQPGAIVPFASNAALHPSSGPAAPVTSSSSGALAIIPQASKEKFEPKSAVWADTLSRGLVNLNISGHKTNPLADIGVDFEAINRKEKRFEKPAANPVASTVTMGKAMGSGSGMGRAGANALRAAPNPMMGAGMGMGGYGGMSQRPVGMGIAMNNGMGQGAHFQPQTGMPQGSMPGNYNSMTGPGGYVPQQPFGGGYR